MMRIFHRVSLIVLALGVLTPFVLSIAQTEDVKKNVLDLNDAIVKKKDEIDKLQKQADVYKKNIALKQQQAATLENQIAILNTRIKEFDLNITITKKEIEESKLELDAIRLEMSEREQEAALARARLGENVRILDETARHSPFEIFLSRESVSAIIEHVQSIEAVQREILDTLGSIQTLKMRLEDTAKEFQNKQETLEHLEERLAIQRQELAVQNGYKARVLGETKEKETLFQGLLQQLRAEQQSIDAEISNLERTIREKLKLLDQSYQGGGGKLLLSWPVDPSRGISAYFHDPSYPFRNIFEHPAIDIRTPQGTAIKTPAPGYVARARDGGMGYSYVMLVHPGGYATVYGHVSRILVKEDSYVERGDVIALSGGAPGTPGAGKLTTGPHLHFEVRVNGVPVNPMDYLF
ncbi:peptidoglycan DD-metalloendopeptidase family protein [Candidatus Uhrbacteria bacterium]|nr:peptidoglycan DD-metalloendopeptidase family protein [Candidatus Uhrbacteria bacterium]